MMDLLKDKLNQPRRFMLFALVIASVLTISLSCSKGLVINDNHERFPIEQVPTEVISRTDDYSKKNNFEIDFLSSARSGFYTLRISIPKKSEKSPSKEVLDNQVANEMLEESKKVEKEIFAGKHPHSLKCSLLVIRIIYKDAAPTYFYSF